MIAALENVLFVEAVVLVVVVVAAEGIAAEPARELALHCSATPSPTVLPSLCA